MSGGGTYKKEALKAAKAAGWRIEQGRQHVKLYPPDGSRPAIVPLSSAGNVGRKEANARAYLRRKGLDL